MSPEASVSAFAPATVGNVICGFDIFGLALEAPGDRVTVRPRSEPGLVITRIEGDDGRLPTDAARNSATVAIRALLALLGREEGMEVDLQKGLPLSGGMGGSAASAVAAVVAADAMLGAEAPQDLLLEAALAGEGMVAGDAHLDNVGPALAGGMVLVRGSRDRPIVPLPVPEGMSVALLHPQVEMSTRDSRRALGDTIALRDAIGQWGSTAAFVHGLHTSDWSLLEDALEDRVAERHRSPAIPAFDAVCAAARAAGAVGCGISGAGPSVVSLCRSLAMARDVGESMLRAFRDEAGPDAALYVSPVAPRGARVVSSTEDVSP